MRTSLLGLTSAFLWAASASATPAFQPLGFIVLGNETLSRAQDVSADGSTVVGENLDAENFLQEGFVWTSDGGMEGLGDLPGGDFASAATGVSADGSTVVGGSVATNASQLVVFEAFVWTRDGGMVGLGSLPGAVTDSPDSYAHGVSADGSVVVGWSEGPAGTEAFRWTSAGGMVGLGDLSGGAFDSTATGVSADGSIVVGTAISTSGQEAFLWTSSGGMEGLGDLPGGAFESHATGVSADGSTVVGWATSAPGFEAFVWTSDSGMAGLGDLPGGAFRSVAQDVSADGSVVVGHSFVTTGLEAFIWDGTHGMRELETLLTDLGVDLTGWRLHEATGISDDGRTIVGWGTNPSGQQEAWIAYLPEPTTGLLLALGALGLGRSRRPKCSDGAPRRF